MKSRFFTKRYSLWISLYVLILLVFGVVYAGGFRLDSLREGLKNSDLTNLQVNEHNGQVSVRIDDLAPGFEAYLSFDATNQRAFVGKLSNFGHAIEIEILNDKAYVLNLEDGISTFDLSVNEGLEVNGTFNKTTQAWSFDADEKDMYLSARERGIYVYTLADGYKVQQFFTEGTALSSIHKDKYLYVANGSKGLATYDISNSSRARFLEKLVLPGVTQHLSFLNNNFLVTSGPDGVCLVDIKNPQSPVLLQTSRIKGSYDSLITIGNFIYVANSNREISIFEFSSGQLNYVSSLPLYGNANAFLLEGNKLYVAERSYGVSSLDVSDPARPQRIGYVGTSGEATGLALYRGKLYVSCSGQGVQIFDLERFETRKFYRTATIPIEVKDISIDQDWIYAAQGYEGIQVLDRNSSGHFAAIGRLPIDGSITVVVQKEELVFAIVATQGIVIASAADPKNLQLLGYLKSEIPFSHLAVRGSELFACSREGKLVRIDISTPSAPRIEEILELPGRAWEIALKGEDVFVAGEKPGLIVVRCKSGEPGRILANLGRPWPMNEFSSTISIRIQGKYAYLVQSEEGLQIVDISLPEKPEEVAVVKLPGRSLRIALSENVAIISNRWNGYYAVDISDPENPLLAAPIPFPRSTSGFLIEGDRLYATGRTNGITELPLLSKGIRSREGAGDVFSFPKPDLPGWYNFHLSDGKEVVTAVAAVRVD